MLALSCAAYAEPEPLFQGRLADGTASANCTVSGDTKCAMFYYATLDITILNNWNIGSGFYRRDAYIGSAQYFAESLNASTGFTGWGLPTGDGNAEAGSLNQYKSIFEAAGGSSEGLSQQFDGVQGVYWSASSSPQGPTDAWAFYTSGGDQVLYYSGTWFNAAAVRPGDVAAVVPEPQTYALMLMGIGFVMLAMRRRPR